MKTASISRISMQLAGLILLVGVTAVPKLQAEFECKQELWAGTWVGNYRLDSIDPEEFGGPYSQVSWFVLDEKGRVTAELDATTPTFGDPDSLTDPTQTQDTQFSITSDCIGRMNITNRASPGGLTGEFKGALVCANAQRECWITFTNPPIYVGIATIKRVEAIDTAIEERVGSLSRKIDGILQRLGLVPSGFEH